MSSHIAVVGAGYVGLATTAMLVEFGHDVVVLDIDPGKVSMLETGHVPIEEPGLEAAFRVARTEGRLSFTTAAEEALAAADVVFICVGTPMWHTGDADLSQIHAAMSQIEEHCPAALVVVKSTVPPGSNADLSSRYPGLSIVSNPEFLRQGSAVADTMQPDRVVVGTNTEEDLARMTKLYGPLIAAGVPIIATNPQSSEMIKYAANSLLGIKVAFINEVADLCEQVGADVEDVARGVGLDPRIGSGFLKAGPGFGGSCFPKDTAAFVQVAERLGSPATIVEAAARANRRRRASLGRRVVEIAGRSPARLRVAVLGLTFKAGTDDVRESPALDLVAELAGHGAKVSVFDPQASPDAVSDMNGVLVAPSAPDAATGADILVIATEWPEFSDIDFEAVSAAMRGTDIVDLRNILDPEPVTAAGLSLHRVGRPSVTPG